RHAAPRRVVSRSPRGILAPLRAERRRAVRLGPVTTHVAIVIGLVLYVVSTTAVSFFLVNRVKKPADYLVAGRGLPYWVLIGTIIGTCIGTGVIIGGSGLAYKHGWAGCAYPIGLGVGTLLTGLFFAKMRRYKF